MEIWKDIEGYEGIYQVSSFGRIKSLNRTVLRKNKLMILKGKILVSNKDNAGYTKVSLCKNSKVKQERIHSLVAKAFLIKLDNHIEINHKDLNKSNNSIENLEWVTCKENSRHRDVNIVRSVRGSSSPKAKLTLEQVLEIRRIGETFTQVEIAKIFNISSGYVWAIKNKKTWNDITIEKEKQKIAAKMGK